MSGPASLPVVFLGPSLARTSAAALLDADYRPPCAKGDVYMAAAEGPPAMGIVDGYFQSRPAVWHKEILWALSRGIPVYGAASIGALRAAELCDYGMVGVGLVFERFRSGEVLGDDEVAVQHGPEELGFPALNTALVDIEATLDRALDDGVIGAGFAETCRSIARESFFPDRRWDRILGRLGADARWQRDCRCLARWLREGTLSVKAADAAAMLARMAGDSRAGWPAPRVEGEFRETLLWRRMVAEIENPFVRVLWAD